ncbi:MAG: AAA family ATPase [Candidatus Competibacteraceae bacterium]|uniref:AAA ATPase n=1 Tax=Candidatus Contendobacter odensis Run_B_J11 TaxID=1400861 RepID=A0A7U7GAC2_9GAMM|nr:AAA family ATPase [Candidatus Contendobacter odensis]MBK8534800.1 AAA family ATPase [Candidatus Competibacteraceae bacterium]MBK8753550.1 AAA family ATPase [Candidatus Competibacteraceae bacterium]CDH44431.1 AAA ATPase [Candidatus Contendobacter odensis Run_B_J11]
MYIGKVILKNIRGFSDLQFDFVRPDGGYAGWTVFTGDNGSGKSTLLKAIAVGLTGKDTARALQPSFHRWIRQGAEDDEASIQLEIVRQGEDDTLTDSGKKPGKAFPAKITLKSGGKETTLQSAIPVKKPKNYSTPDRTIWSTDAKGWFSCGYGPFRRVFGASPEAARQMVAPSTERFVTMFQEAASLAEVDQWLRNLKHKELENKAAEREQLTLLLNILRDELMPNQITLDRVDSDGLWLKDRNGVQLSWREMSDGYRAALALLADILRHLINAYGMDGLTEQGPDGKFFIKRSGVVLVDEIDAHLHPEWQREIGFWLKRHFPNIQFLVTTHSPIICQAADEKGLFVLPEPGSDIPPQQLNDEEYRKVIASRPDTILLTSAFGLQNTRSPRAVEGRAELAKLRAKQRAGGKLTAEEANKDKQLEIFVADEEEL